VCASVMQCVAVLEVSRLSVLQCVAVCCSVLQCVAVLGVSRLKSFDATDPSMIVNVLFVAVCCSALQLQ